ncbi:hypothetical protein C9374_008197 [Naegleria lovaniensis]|uniref:Uncharacterized protein n=1 Tax=Naegleria lovaniensis TaxID=51637 RepID=A0AA88GHC4_NAELO|nr:uncharacterized protein C9374_008197 [Naegleria lovaniensis]KAG2378558.1 hypothetical protein C9374_008197 [Naegleria lovaniensis]
MEIDPLSFSIPDTIMTSLLAGSLFLVAIFIIVFSTSCYKYLGSSSAVARKRSSSENNNNMKRNQCIMIGLILILVIIQVLGLLCRGIWNSISMSIVLQAKDYVANHYASNSSLYLETFVYENSSLVINDGSVIPYSKLQGMSAMLSFELFFTLSNLSVLMLIMCFIGNVFIRTVQMTSTQKSFLGTGYTRARILFNVLTITFSFTVWIVVWIIAIVRYFTKMKLVQDFQMLLCAIGYSIFLVQICLQLAATIVVSIKMLKVINFNRSKHQHNNSQTKQAFIKVVVLQITLTLCAFLQIIAMGFGAVIVEWKYFHWFYLILNNLGVLLFAVVSLALYHPIFHFKNSTTVNSTTLHTQQGKSPQEQMTHEQLNGKKQQVGTSSHV